MRIIATGEDYFADVIIGLSDEQKELAEDYAQALGPQSKNIGLSIILNKASRRALMEG